MRVSVVTGSNSGLGLGVVLRLMEEGEERGEQVIMACRSVDKAEQARGEVLQELKRRGKLFPSTPSRLSILRLDLSDFASIRAAVQELRSRYRKVDVLYANAGVFHVSGNDYWAVVEDLWNEGLEHFLVTSGRFLVQPVGKVTRDGFGDVFMANVFGHYLMIREMEDLLEGGGRVVWSSSTSGVRKAFDPEDLQHVRGTTAYQASKYLVNLVSLALNERYRGRGIFSFNTAPGFVVSTLSYTMVPAFFWIFIIPVMVLLRVFYPSLCVDSENGAESNVYAGTMPHPEQLDTSLQYVSKSGFWGSNLLTGRGGTRYVEPKVLKDVSLDDALQVTEQLEDLRNSLLASKK